MLAREWRGRLERVSVLEDGFAWNGRTYGSLSMVAKAITGASWNGHRFFGLRSGRGGDCDGLHWTNRLDARRRRDGVRRDAVHPWAA